jgi:hypothetical protein
MARLALLVLGRQVQISAGSSSPTALANSLSPSSASTVSGSFNSALGSMQQSFSSSTGSSPLNGFASTSSGGMNSGLLSGSASGSGASLGSSSTTTSNGASATGSGSATGLGSGTASGSGSSTASGSGSGSIAPQAIKPMIQYSDGMSDLNYAPLSSSRFTSDWGVTTAASQSTFVTRKTIIVSGQATNNDLYSKSVYDSFYTPGALSQLNIGLYRGGDYNTGFQSPEYTSWLNVVFGVSPSQYSMMTQAQRQYYRNEWMSLFHAFNGSFQVVATFEYANVNAAGFNWHGPLQGNDPNAGQIPTRDAPLPPSYVAAGYTRPPNADQDLNGNRWSAQHSNIAPPGWADAPKASISFALSFTCTGANPNSPTHSESLTVTVNDLHGTRIYHQIDWTIRP